jgi:hypothetical protein
MTSSIFDKKEATRKAAKEYDNHTAAELIALKTSHDPADVDQYNRMRQGKVDRGELSQQSGYLERGMRLGSTPYKPAEPIHDSATLIAMAKFPKSVCDRWYKSTLSPEDVALFNQWVPENPSTKDKAASISRLRSEAPSVFNELETAALAHRVIVGPRRTDTAQAESRPADDGRINLGDKLGAVVGLPGTYRVTPEQYNDVLQFANAQAAAKAA